MKPSVLALARRAFLAALVLPAAALAQAPAATLTVSAAASLTDVLKELAPAFEASHPGTTLRYNFAASGVLIQQIAQGAPVDVFISADTETVDRGIAQKLLDPGSRRDIAANQLALIVPSGATLPVRGLADLARPEVRRVAMGKPATTPAGRYARQALEAGQLWASVEGKVVPADSVRQALDYVARGEADAGFVFRTDAAPHADKVRIVGIVDGHTPVRYPAALVSDGRQKALAGDFVAYLLSPAAQGVLARHGFAKP